MSQLDGTKVHQFAGCSHGSLRSVIAADQQFDGPCYVFLVIHTAVDFDAAAHGSEQAGGGFDAFESSCFCGSRSVASTDRGHECCIGRSQFVAAGHDANMHRLLQANERMQLDEFLTRRPRDHTRRSDNGTRATSYADGRVTGVSHGSSQHSSHHCRNSQNLHFHRMLLI
jgi:hypothetical protein